MRSITSRAFNSIWRICGRTRSKGPRIRKSAQRLGLCFLVRTKAKRPVFLYNNMLKTLQYFVDMLKIIDFFNVLTGLFLTNPIFPPLSLTPLSDARFYPP